MDPSRYLIRAIGFFMVVFALIAFTYPMIERAVHSGKQEFLATPLSSEEFTQLQAEKGIMAALPIRLYTSRIYRTCYKELEQLCKKVNGLKDPIDGTKCLLEKIEVITNDSCKELLTL